MCFGLQVLKKRPDFRENPWPKISSSAKDFVKKLLRKDPRARPTAAQALCQYPFPLLPPLPPVEPLLSVPVPSPGEPGKRGLVQEGPGFPCTYHSSSP